MPSFRVSVYSNNVVYAMARVPAPAGSPPPLLYMKRFLLSKTFFFIHSSPHLNHNIYTHTYITLDEIPNFTSTKMTVPLSTIRSTASHDLHGHGPADVVLHSQQLHDKLLEA
jgi:hypothetical protein